MVKKRNPPALKPAKILIVDDHPLVREGLAGLIARHPAMTVCGEAADVAEALEQIKRTKPDLVIVDLALRHGHGTDLIRDIKTEYPRIKMLVASIYDEKLYAERVLRAGAMGYINKQDTSEKVLVTSGTSSRFGRLSWNNRPSQTGKKTPTKNP